MSLATCLDPQTWAMEQWGTVELGDSRRNERAVAMGAALAANPASSLPKQMGTWNDLCASYRLLGEAVRLLQLRTLSRSHPDHPVQPLIPEPMLELLRVRLGLFAIPATLGEFWRSVARLGGFLARKSDGQPGWQTLWRGWLRLQDFCWGADFALNKP